MRCKHNDLATASRLIAAALGVALVFAANVAFAQQADAPAAADTDAEAKALFEAGRVAFDAGRFEGALSRWTEAYQLSGRAKLLYNVGLALDRLRRDDEAIAAFEGYLDEHPGGSNALEVRSRIAAIRAAKAASVPTAAEAAETVPIAEPESAPAEAKRDGTPWYGKWWVWAITGAVVAGVVVGVAVAAGGDEPGSPVEPNTGVSTFTLVRQ